MATKTTSRFRIVWRKPYQVSFEGVDFTVASRAQWQHQFDLFGALLQDEIYNEFAAQRVAGKQLRANTPEYNQQKAMQGYDTRKGHRTNELQAALAGSRLFVVTFNPGRAFLTFSENRLISRAAQAEYYADAKVHGGRILAVSAAMVKRASGRLLAWARTQEAKAARMRKADAAKSAALLRAGGSGLPASVASRVRNLTAQFEAQAALKKSAPFAGRSPFIRPGLGLTQSFVRRFR